MPAGHGVKHGGPTGEFNQNVLLKGKIFVYTHSDCYLNLKQKERFNLFRQPTFLLLAHHVKFPGSFDTKPFRYKAFWYKLKSIRYDNPRASTKTLKTPWTKMYPPKNARGGTQGKFGKRCAAEAFKHRPCLRQKLLISLPCLRQETLLSDRDLFVLHTELSSFSH